MYVARGLPSLMTKKSSVNFISRKTSQYSRRAYVLSVYIISGNWIPSENGKSPFILNSFIEYLLTKDLRETNKKGEEEEEDQEKIEKDKIRNKK